MNPERIAEGLYRHRAGSFYTRWNEDGKRSWRKLHSLTAAEAKKELAALLVDASRIKAGLVQAPKPVLTIGELFSQYISRGCPNKRLEVRPEAFRFKEARHVKLLAPFWESKDSALVGIPDVLQYAEFRRGQCVRGTGNRTIDLELSTLSNAFTCAVSLGLVKFNPVVQRPRFVTAKDVRHCRETAPASAAELHTLAAHLFDQTVSEVLAWQTLFEALTGCRTSEILRLRIDGTRPEHPGFIDGGFLFVARSKRGVNPYAQIHPDLADCIRAHRHWLGIRFPESPFWFPGKTGDGVVDKTSLTHALTRAARDLGLPHRTSHGLRSYYVTTRRGQGVPDWQIAAEIGDKTAELISRTYGDRPANWTTGSSQHGWVPAGQSPAWAIWRPESSGVVPMPTQSVTEVAV